MTSAVPSFEKFNYLLRPNKHIERRLIFEFLARISDRISLPTYRYMGFGSIWFGDFILASRLLQIDDMWSLEREKYATRADFNRPYDNIKVIAGHSNTVLRPDNQQAWDKPLIAWLDYDGKLSTEVVKDIVAILGSCKPHSVLVVTVNALWKAYKSSSPGGTIESVKELLHPDVIDRRFDPGKTATGVQKDVLESSFPDYLATCLLNFMGHKVAAGGRVLDGEQLVFVPLASICHVDGAEMVTVAGVVTTRRNGDFWRGALPFDLSYDSQGRVRHVRLDLTHITVKEKLAMDRCLPSNEAQFVHRTSQLRLGLSREARRKYRLHYRYFPIYAESII